MISQAFVLGAGLGERLRPLTAQLPKPLIPLFHRPLMSYAFDHLLAAGVKRFVVNTHHLPRAYDQAFPGAEYRGASIAFREEQPQRLETAGGIANVRDLLNEEPFLVFNGDIWTDLPLQPLWEEHQRRGNLVTLALRSVGPAQHISWDAESGLVTDIRNQLGTGNAGTHLFTGIYLCQPEIHEWLTPGKVESVIPIFLKMIQQGARLGALVIDDGQWWDLGSRSAYLEAHRALHQQIPHPPAISAEAQIAADAQLHGFNVIGCGSFIEPGAVLEDCLLWPGARVAAGSRLRDCIIRTGITAQGEHAGVDF
jgi:mannose-1-phosphate guanylyltransferase